MSTQPQPGTRFVFGPFELAPDTAELRKHGTRIRLAGQPFQILLFLVENAGEAVSREQLREHVWSEGTFVDFEHGLNAAVNKLRRALGDSADSPRYIQTVPGQGYRFIGTLERSSNTVVAPNILIPSISEQPHNLSRSPYSFGLNRLGIGAAAASLILLAGAIAWYFLRTPSQPALARTEKRLVVLSDFVNSTNDPAFGTTLRQSLAVQLQHSPHFSLLPEARVQTVLHLMRKAQDAPLTPELGREICERMGGIAVVEPSVANLGTQYALGLRARDCVTGEVMEEQQKLSGSKEDSVRILSRMVSGFESGTGSLFPLSKSPGVPLPELTTQSLEALKSYSTGMNVLLSTGETEALPLFRRAVELDPEFAFAHSHLGRLYSDLGESALAAKSITTAYRLRDRVSDRENFFITYNYHREVTRNLELARQTCESWVHKYPNDLYPHAFLSGFTSQGSGRYELAINEGKNALAIEPNHSIVTFNVVSSYISLNRLGEAEAMLKQASVRKLDLAELSLSRYLIAFLKGDQVAMERESVSRRGKGEAQGWFPYQEALTMAYHGKLKQARILLRHAVTLAQQAGLTERAATYEGGSAVMYALFGDNAQAKQSAEAALAMARGRDADYGPAFALALSQESAQAQNLVSELEHRYPEDTSVRFKYLPSLRALLALGRKKSDTAIEFTEGSASYEFAIAGTSYTFFGSLYCTYVRGLAYLDMHQYAKAIGEFRKILDHPGLVLNDPVGAVVRLQLARAWNASGDKVKAKAAYQDFLSLWKEADLDVPIFLQAKNEFARF